MTDDAELLRRYAGNRDKDAFAELVRRHFGLVYHAALRQCGGDAHRAEDVAQAVFTDLARKAEKLARRPVLAGWLYTSTRYAAGQAVRTEVRRQAREQEVHAMNEILSNSTAEPAAEWERLRPVIDDALHALGERDREAVLLRFFEDRAFADVGTKLFLSEDAARMRVERALEKLRAALVRRGITSTTAALGVALANQAGVAAPAGLATTVTGSALAGAASGGAGAWLAFLTMSKIKAGIVGAILVAAVATGLVELRANRDLRAELGALRSSDDEVAHLRRANRQVGASLQRLGGKNPEADELGRLHARIAQLEARPDGVVDAELQPPQNLGRATPSAAFETFAWAVDRHDLDLIGTFFTFSDDTAENRQAFMANFSEVVRARYRTPERLCAAVCFNTPDPGVAMQVTSITEDRGPDQVKINIWIRSASGREFAGHDTYVRRADGWALKPVSLADPAIVALALSRLDPVTGNPLQPGK